MKMPLLEILRHTHVFFSYSSKFIYTVYLLPLRYFKCKLMNVVVMAIGSDGHWPISVMKVPRVDYHGVKRAEPIHKVCLRNLMKKLGQA